MSETTAQTQCGNTQTSKSFKVSNSKYARETSTVFIINALQASDPFLFPLKISEN